MKKKMVRIIAILIVLLCCIGIAFNHSESKSISYLLGMICGVATATVFLVVATWLIRKVGGKIDWNCNGEKSYDERQLLARGVAYKYAFFTLMFGVGFACLLDEIAGISLFMSFAGIWLMICLSLAVFATICIVKDAYMSLYENVKGGIMMFSIVAILNLGVGIMNIVNGTRCITDGVLTIGCTNMIVGVLFLYILLVFVGRVIYSNRQLEEDEE